MSGRTIRLLLLVSVLCSAAGARADRLERFRAEPDNVYALRMEYADATVSGDYDEALARAFELRKALPAGDNAAGILTAGYIGQAYLLLNRYEEALKWLHEGLALWNAADEPGQEDMACKGMYHICISLGIHAAETSQDYPAAVEYFHRGMLLAEGRSDYYYCILCANMVETYNLRKDPSALKYAEEIYAYGQKSGNPEILYAGSYVMASMAYLNKDTERARRYVEESIALSGPYYGKAERFILYADILEAQGDAANAEIQYRKAYDAPAESANARILGALSYGDFLIAHGRYPEAVATLERGIALADSSTNELYTYRLYERLSEAHEKTADWKNALESYKRFHDASVDVLNIENERTIGNLRLRYEDEKHKNEIHRYDIKLLQRTRVLLTLACVAVVVLGAGIAAYVMYRKRNDMYLRIVKQFRESVRKEEELQRQIEALRRPNGDSGEATERGAKQSGADKLRTPADGRRRDELFARIEHQMRHERIWRQPLLTKERVAEMLGSNRTYVSQSIVRSTGLSFTDYVNSYRIDEAIRLLSDAENSTPLKALSSDIGFNSITSFYKYFSAKVGMTPNKYRKKVEELSNNDKFVDSETNFF